MSGREVSLLLLLLATPLIAGCVVDETDIMLRADGSGYIRRIVTPTTAYQETFARKYDRVVGYRTLTQEAEAERARWGKDLKVERLEIERNDQGEATKVMARFGFRHVNDIVVLIPALEGGVAVTPMYTGHRLDLRFPDDEPRPRPKEAELRERERQYQTQYRNSKAAFDGARVRMSFYFPRGFRSSDATHVDAGGRRITLYDVHTGRLLEKATAQGGWLRQLLLASTRKDRNALLGEIPGTRIEGRPTITVTLQN